MSEDRTSIVIVRQATDAGGNLVWIPGSRFASTGDAKKWLSQSAGSGVYHLVALRYEGIEVKEAPPAPTRNEVVMGKQHLTRTRADEADAEG